MIIKWLTTLVTPPPPPPPTTVSVPVTGVLTGNKLKLANDEILTVTSCQVVINGTELYNLDAQVEKLE